MNEWGYIHKNKECKMLEEIIYNLKKGIELTDFEKKKVEEICMRD